MAVQTAMIREALLVALARAGALMPGRGRRERWASCVQGVLGCSPTSSAMTKFTGSRKRGFIDSASTICEERPRPSARQRQSVSIRVKSVSNVVFFRAQT
jgi:hypothetical protein